MLKQKKWSIKNKGIEKWSKAAIFIKKRDEYKGYLTVSLAYIYLFIYLNIYVCICVSVCVAE